MSVCSTRWYKICNFMSKGRHQCQTLNQILDLPIHKCYYRVSQFTYIHIVHTYLHILHNIPPGPSMLRFEALSTWTMPLFPDFSPAVSLSEIAFQSRFWTMPHYCSNTSRGIVHMDNAAFPNFFLGAVTSGCLCKRHCPTLQNWVSELILDNAALLQQYSQKRVKVLQ